MHTKTKLLMVIDSLSIGGAEKQFINVVKGLDRNKYSITICTFGAGGFTKDIPLDVDYYKITKRNKYDLLRLIFIFGKLVKSLRPNVIYTRACYASFIANAARLIYRFQIPIIANEEHDHTQEIVATGKKKYRSYIYRYAYGSSDHVLVPTKGVKEDIVKSYRLVAENVSVIYNSLDISEIQNGITDGMAVLPGVWNKGTFKLVAFGRLDKRKAYDFLIEVFAKIAHEFQTELFFIGDGPEREPLERLTAQHGLEDKIHFLGFVDNPYYVLSECHLLVMTSLWEGFGNVIIEALACGLPVVTTNFKHGPEEILQGHGAGLISAEMSVGGMANSITKILNDPALHKKMSRAALIRSKDFHLTIIAKQFETVFDRYACGTCVI